VSGGDANFPIVNNVVSLPCDGSVLFEVQQTGFTGTFTLSDAGAPSGTNLSPLSGTSTTIFDLSNTANGSGGTYSIIGTGGGGKTGALTVNWSSCSPT
jgi:hypothetical protein